MGKLCKAVILFLAIISAGAAAAQSAWVQIEAHPSLTEGEDRARTYARDFPNVGGYQLRSGWYAIVIGPFNGAEAADRLRALRSERLIPSDSFIADGSNFQRAFWPVGGGIVAPAPQPGTTTETVAVPVPDPAPSDETPAQARQSERNLTREDRELLQTALKWEGFYTSGIDGAFGPGTRNAMKDWQEANGVEGTGILTTKQRNTVLAAYQAVIDGLGMSMVRDNTAGIEIKLPTALVVQGAYQPPFAHYDSTGNSGVQVILISQEGDQDSLFGLYDILQTLEIMPLEGDRERGSSSFVLTGQDDKIHSHAEATLTRAGNIKGFILIWPAGDEKRRELALSEMRASFAPIGDAVLPDAYGADQEQSIDLISGLEIRRPTVSRTGFYFDASGNVLTTADSVAQCGRITLDDELEADVVASDEDLGVAVLKAREALAPLGFARFQPSIPRLQSEVAVSGYSYDGRLGAAVLTFGRLAELTGLRGEESLTRLALAATSGDAGGPVFDGSGAVLGMLLPPDSNGGQVLPEDVSFAADGEAIAVFLAGAGFAATPSEPNSGDIAPEELTRLALDMTVQVSCWN